LSWPWISSTNLYESGICTLELYTKIFAEPERADNVAIKLKKINSIMSSPRFLWRPTAFMDLLWPWDVREFYIRNTADFPSNYGSAHFHVSWLFDFIFYQKPLYKSLHQSFFYSFITILPSESGVTHDYCMIFPGKMVMNE
jgi:hypothetical protein